eukprot:10002796-Ditylum_brightwellii.AAC.1
MSKKAVKVVLSHGDVFQRCKMTGQSITSCHSILGFGGMTKKWKRLRKVCDPFFAAAQFQDRTDNVIQHIIDAVTLASKEAAPGKIEYFQLINRLVVEVHLMAILGVKSIPPSGQHVDLCDKEELAKGKTDGGCAGGN